jgi:hypothetical protein
LRWRKTTRGRLKNASGVRIEKNGFRKPTNTGERSYFQTMTTLYTNQIHWNLNRTQKNLCLICSRIVKELTIIGINFTRKKMFITINTTA